MQQSRIKPPNILLLMTDQQRHDSLGCYGCDKVNTPALDKLAADGAVFDNCYVNSTICTPSRASLMTGKPVQGHGVYKLHDFLPEDQVLFPSRLKEKGYQTALIGKLHVSGHAYESQARYPDDGFDRYEWCNDPSLHLDSTYNAYASWVREHNPEFWGRMLREGRNVSKVPSDAHFTYWAAERTIDFIETADRDQPFFCFMSLFDPHNPYDTYPIEALKTVNQDKIRQPHDNTVYRVDTPDDVQREQNIIQGKYTQEEIRNFQIGYYASIGFLDTQIGRVLDKLEELGLSDNTLVIFLSDHGDMLGERDLLTKGAYFYDASSKVPFLMRLPGTIPAGVRRSHLIQPNDVAATLLHIAGHDEEVISRWMPHAMNLLPLATNTDAVGRDHAVAVYRNTGINNGGRYWSPEIHCTMFRDKRYKLNVYHEPTHGEYCYQGELFDMDADPDESMNLWNQSDFSVVKMELLIRMMNWIVGVDTAYQSGRGGEGVGKTVSTHLIDK